MEPMTVANLIDRLRAYRPDMPVYIFSEECGTYEVTQVQSAMSMEGHPIYSGEGEKRVFVRFLQVAVEIVQIS